MNEKELNSSEKSSDLYYKKDSAVRKEPKVSVDRLMMQFDGMF